MAGKRTLIVVSRAPTELKDALAGVMLDVSLARFNASMDEFNTERLVSFPRCGSDIVGMGDGLCRSATATPRLRLQTSRATRYTASLLNLKVKNSIPY